MTPHRHSKRLRSATGAPFTLVELLTVVGIVALLAVILLPVLGKARDRSRAAVCLNQVRQIGQALHEYANDNRDLLPVCARLGPDTTYGLPSLRQALESTWDASAGAFRCPADRGTPSLFEEVGTSYEWNTFVNGRTIDRAGFRVLGLEVTAPLFGDAEAFHARGTRNYLYADGHVAPSLEILIQ